MPEHGARVRLSWGINVNTPFPKYSHRSVFQHYVILVYLEYSVSRTKHYFVPLPRHQCSGTKCEHSLDSKGSVESQASSGFHSTRELVLSSNKITMNNHTLIEFSGLRDSHSIHPTHGGNRLKCHLPFDKIQYAVFFLDIFTFKNWRREREREKA